MAAAKSLIVPLLAAALAAPLVPGAALAGGYGHADRLDGYSRGGYSHDGYRHDSRQGYGRHDNRRDDRHFRQAPPPRSYVRIWLGDGLGLFWSDGFVGPYGHDRLVLAPAIGMRVGHVPAGYISIVIAPSRYFYVGGAYYVWDVRHRDYLVVPKPKGADAAMRDARAEREDLFADSDFDRGDPVRDWDRHACDEWAASETGGVERSAPGSPGRGDYLRAVASCLEGRGYTIK